MLPDKLRGWNYSSNYLGGSSTNPFYIESSQLDYDLADIAAAGIGVIKIYADENNPELHLAALDKVAAAGLQAIVLRFITYGTDYSIATGGANRTAAIAKFTGMIENLKDHAAIIGWGFGNENNINLGSTSAADWYSLLDAACAAGKVIDDTRWYFTADADLGTYVGDTELTNLDVLGLNIYRGQTITDLVADIQAATSKPVLITEFGIERADDSYPEKVIQANQIHNLIKEIEDAYDTIVGWVHFKYTETTGVDYWEATEPLAQGDNRSRHKYPLYERIKDYCNSFLYGEGLKILMSDGFECGDFSAWSSSVTDSGDLSVSADAKIHGNYGMSVLIDGTGLIYVQDDTPEGETKYRISFSLDPNSLTMANNDEFNIFRAVKLADTTCFVISLGYTTVGGYYIKVSDRTDAGNFSKATSSHVLTDAPHLIEVEWVASTGAGANNGQLTLWIDGVLKQTVTAIDSDTEVIDFVRFGAAQNVDAGTTGTLYLDDFVSSRTWSTKNKKALSKMSGIRNLGSL